MKRHASYTFSFLATCMDQENKEVTLNSKSTSHISHGCLKSPPIRTSHHILHVKREETSHTAFCSPMAMNSTTSDHNQSLRRQSKPYGIVHSHCLHATPVGKPGLHLLKLLRFLFTLDLNFFLKTWPSSSPSMQCLHVFVLTCHLLS